MNDNESINVKTYSDLIENVNKNISLEAKISREIFQHLIDFNSEYPNIYYVDLNDGSQTVIYLKERINLDPGDSIKIEGKSIQISGGSKRPSKSKSSEKYTEYQIIVFNLKKM